MAILGVDQFKAKLAGGGARPNLFKITLAYPRIMTGDVELTSFMCNAGQLPASTMATVLIPYRGRQTFMAGDRTFDPWSVNVINDTNFEVRRSMETWMNSMNAHQSNTGVTSPLDYTADLTVDQLDKNETILYTYKFRGCFPTNVSAIQLSYATNDQIEEFSVDFRIDYWESFSGGEASGAKVTS
jgi:hypothetical protein